MSYVDAFDTLGAISAFELTLLELGYTFDAGAGGAAAPRTLAGT